MERPGATHNDIKTHTRPYRLEVGDALREGIDAVSLSLAGQRRALAVANHALLLFGLAGCLRAAPGAFWLFLALFVIVLFGVVVVALRMGVEKLEG